MLGYSAFTDHASRQQRGLPQWTLRKSDKHQLFCQGGISGMKIVKFPFKFSSVTPVVAKLWRFLLAMFWNCARSCVWVTHRRVSLCVQWRRLFPLHKLIPKLSELTASCWLKRILVLTLTQSQNFKLYRNLPVELFSVSCHSVDSGITIFFLNRFPFRKIKTFPVKKTDQFDRYGQCNWNRFNASDIKVIFHIISWLLIRTIYPFWVWVEMW